MACSRTVRLDPSDPDDVPVYHTAGIMILSHRPHLSPYAKNTNPGSTWAYFPENRIFMTGLFRGFFDPVSPIISIISQNHELTGFL
jgi:hypothetical protein